VPPILSFDHQSTFAQSYNRACFLFDHRLHEHPIFDLAHLVDVSRRLPDSYWSTQPSDIAAGWGDGSKGRSLPDTIATMPESNSLALLKGLERDPEFAPLYEQVIREIGDSVGAPLRDDVSIGRATLIVSSPGRITPYHIDAEVNFLLQLRGTKTVNVFDGNDRTLLTDPELEAFYAGDFSAAKYKEQRQTDAHVFDFRPGHGVHIPLHAPHWTRNGPDVSVALSLNFSLRSNAATAQIYRFNRLLRKSGIRPQAPGRSPWQDRVKAVVGAGVERARELVRR
jgi:hypothetical protein